MKKGLTYLLNIIIAFIVSASVPVLRAQNVSVDSLLFLGDSLRAVYRFDESVAAYTKAVECLDSAELAVRDSAFLLDLNDKILLSENGRNMAGFVYTPVVIARHRFSLEDFFLYYPLKDRSWRQTPNQLDSLSGKYARALYAPSEDKVIYYSATDQEGIRNIYRTSLADTVWTLPSLLNEHMISASDENYPMLSPDKKRMFFASQGLYGVGGYDLYVSEWDENQDDWSVPVNMGFPYSSPANDFLLVNSEDGRYTVFASDRGCPADSVCVYVLEYDSMPVRSRVDDPEELLKLSFLEPVLQAAGQGGDKIESNIPENIDTRRYMDKMAQVRALRDSISFCEKSIADLREVYALTESETEKNRLEEGILKNEALVPQFQARLDEAVRQLQEVEMDFLFSGVVIDPDRLQAEAEREIISENPDYVFTKMNMGEPLTLEMEKPVAKFDYSFKVLEEACFAEDNTIPEGIVYQIQLFSVTSPASIKSLKGLSPIFETRSSSGRYIYRVGLFNTYADVLSNLNTVKRLGFKSAYVVGYVDGKEMSVKKVRDIQAERKKAAQNIYYKVSVIPAGGDLDGVSMAGIRQQAGGKDIARTEDGIVIGPFDNRTEAVALVEFIQVMGYGEAKLETIQNNL